MNKTTSEKLSLVFSNVIIYYIICISFIVDISAYIN